MTDARHPHPQRPMQPDAPWQQPPAPPGAGWQQVAQPTPSHGTSSAQPRARGRNVLGLVSLLLGVAHVVATLALALAYAFAPGISVSLDGTSGLEHYVVLDRITLAAMLLFGLGGLALGIVALVRPGLPRAAAAAGTAIAGTTLVTWLGSQGAFLLADLLRP